MSAVRFAPYVVFTLMLSMPWLTGCGQRNALTQEKAQHAIDRWVIQHQSAPGSVVLQGLHEIPQENRADGDLALSGFGYEENNVMGGTSSRTYDGPGVAHFIRYTDGRWILKRVDFGEGMNLHWDDNLNIQAVPEDKSGGAAKREQDEAGVQYANEAREMMLNHHGALDLAKFFNLLSNAARSGPAASKEAASVLRRFATMSVGYEPGDRIQVMLDSTLAWDPSLAADDTMLRMHQVYRLPLPPAIAQEVARHQKPSPPGEVETIVVPYRELPPGTCMAMSAPGAPDLYVAGMTPDFPRVLTRVAPVDPRGARAPATDVELAVAIGKDGRVPAHVTPLHIADRDMPTVQLLSGPAELEAAAAAAVRQWTFAPMHVLGNPIETIARVQVAFGAGAVSAAPPPSAAPSPPMRKPTDATVAPMPAPGSDEDLPKFGEYVYVEELPEAVKKVQPVMPPDAAARGLEGTVMVQVLVGRDGRVLRTQVTKSVPGLDEAALTAARQWVFKPALSNKKPVPVWVAVPLRFPPR